MGAIRFDYIGRESFYSRLRSAGLRESSAKGYVTNILHPEKENTYRAAAIKWKELMDIPIPSINDVIETNVHTKEDKGEESSRIRIEPSHKECIKLIEELKEERESLFAERKGLKTSVHLHKSTSKNLREHINHLQKVIDGKDKIIAELESSQNSEPEDSSQEIEMLKAVIADQAILIYALHKSKGCDHV